MAVSFENSAATATDDQTHVPVGTNGIAHTPPASATDLDPQETTEWLESLEAIVRSQGIDRARFVLEQVIGRAYQMGVGLKAGTTPYLNTIPTDEQPDFPGDRVLERRIKNLVRWNAMAMVQKANKTTNVGGHIATYQSAATLYEMGFNHFFQGKTDKQSGDVVYFQGHASPGMYARAFIEGRLTEQQLLNFRQELQPGGGLSSYPHPWLMPSFWQFPSVSMGLAPLMAIYQARFNRYLRDRGLANTDNCRVWAFLGDGECDEPETLGAITVAAREKLDNLCFIINCNLQRLDGPVRGNGKIIQELESLFRGAGWNVVKVVWGSEWDDLLARDTHGALARRMLEVVDGEYQEYVGRDMRTDEERAAKIEISEAEDADRRGAFIREKFFNTTELQDLVADLSNAEIATLKRGGHDPLKVYSAYRAAVENRGTPTVILAKTIKGYGTSAAGKNTAHQIKSIALKQFRDYFDHEITDAELEQIPFIKLPEGSPEAQYLHDRRKALGGYQPYRETKFTPCTPPDHSVFESMQAKTIKPQSTTLAWVKLMVDLMSDPNIGHLIVPIVPDEGQTFGMPPMYNKFGIYSQFGQLYTPVDQGTVTEYREDKAGQILQEGINEAGSMCSFIAAGTAYSTHGVNTIPFYIYYSMFGFQRVGDFIWAAADSRCRGFLMGATAGRTTLNGEGLQHEDGHSHLVAMTIPTCRAYDPAYGYELAVIIEDGIKRMFVDNEEIFYYLTVYNENYDMPAMPDGAREGILKGMYKLRDVSPPNAKHTVQLLGSGVILNEVLRAQQILADKYGVASTVYSVTSYPQLRRDAMDAERHNRLHPTQAEQVSFVEQILGPTKGPIVAASDSMRALPESIGMYLDGRLLALGTDGFGRSETRKMLRRFFEVDAECITAAALYELAKRGELDKQVVTQAIADLGIDPDRPAPWTV